MALRCLRCGDFALGEPHGSGPAAEASLVPHGKVPRDQFILRFLVIERAARGAMGMPPREAVRAWGACSCKAEEGVPRPASAA